MGAHLACQLCPSFAQIESLEALFDPAVTKKVFEWARHAARESEDMMFASLSIQELRILALVAQEKTSREIAKNLFLSEETTRNYMSSILDKLNLSTRSEVAAYAVKHHIDGHVPTQ